jgi:hypothetical protein
MMRTRTSPRNQERLFTALFRQNNAQAKKIDRRKPCCWTQDDCTCSWDTNCGEKHQFIEGDPRENRYRYCPYCGRPLQQLQKIKELEA